MTDEPPSVFSTTEARARFNEVLDRVQKGEHVTIAYRGTPAAVLVDMATYEDFRRVMRQVSSERSPES